jgi:hypothetical protein
MISVRNLVQSKCITIFRLRVFSQIVIRIQGVEGARIRVKQSDERSEQIFKNLKELGLRRGSSKILLS